MAWKADLDDGMFRLVTTEGRRFLDQEPHDRPWVTPEAVRVVEFDPPDHWRTTPWIRFLNDVAPEAKERFAGLAFETTYGLDKETEPDTERLIDRLIWVAHAGPDEALDLAQRVGPLRLCACHALPHDACLAPILEREGLIPEPLLAWYLWAREVWLVVQLLNVLKTAKGEDERRTRAEEFALRSLECWSALQAAADSFTYDEATETFSGSLGDYPVSIPELRVAGVLLQGETPERQLCLRAVAERVRRWMGYGAVLPRLEVEPPRSFRFQLTGDGLFGAVAKHLCFVALGQDDWHICHHCKRVFAPTHKVRSNQKLVFCTECRTKDDGVIPQRYRQRRYRAKKGENDE